MGCGANPRRGIEMTDDVQRQITWLLCFDDGEADHIGAARCAETMKSQQARIELLEKVLEAVSDFIGHYTIASICEHKAEELGYQAEWNALNDAVADCDKNPAPVPTKKPGKAHPWRKTKAPQR